MSTAWLSALSVALVISPIDARADERCVKKCAQRQSNCAEQCGDREKCRQHCGRSADTCFAQCQRTDEARETAQQRRDEKNCVGDDGRMRTCSAAEERQLRRAMQQASKMFCQDENGEQDLCPEQRKQLEEARKFMPKDCNETGCASDKPR